MSVLLLVASLSAAAADSLEWRWGDVGSVRYRTQTFLQVPNGYRFLGLSNRDARALETAMMASFTCSGEPHGKKAFAVNCSIDEVKLQGKAVATEQEKLELIFASHEETLKQGRVEMIIRTDGHIRVLDLEGVEKKWERGNDVHEQLRQLLRRALCCVRTQLTPPRRIQPLQERLEVLGYRERAPRQ